MCLRWLQHEPGRIQHCSTILDSVQWIDVSWLAAEMKFIQEPQLARALADFMLLKDNLCLSQVPTMASLQLYVVGGRLQLPDGAVEITATALKYDLRTRTWSNIAPMGTPRTGHGVAVLNDQIYVAGGQGRLVRESGDNGEGEDEGEGGDDEITTLATAEVYDPESDEWSLLPPMREARSHFGLVACNNCLYAFGGECDGRLKSSIEKYDPLLRDWVMLGDMPEPRSQMSVVNFNKYNASINEEAEYPLTQLRAVTITLQPETGEKRVIYAAILIEAEKKIELTGVNDKSVKSKNAATDAKAS
ncbi:Kelch-like protein 5 [Eumeta japonica]|uniref:Kelch-like protein 5 n=1 Tax=Eumeta variegata TaxID=151549 RepID=A0A4C1W8T8_EUMVA|nr:Kelch-like protein 5 [Eumeta japonica]